MSADCNDEPPENRPASQDLDPLELAMAVENDLGAICQAASDLYRTGRISYASLNRCWADYRDAARRTDQVRRARRWS